MTKDDIMKMAKAAGFADTFDDVHAFYQLEHFANLVVAHEREACAKLVETQNAYGDPVTGWFDILASAIRARSQS